MPSLKNKKRKEKTLKIAAVFIQGDEKKKKKKLNSLASSAMMMMMMLRSSELYWMIALRVPLLFCGPI